MTCHVYITKEKNLYVATDIASGVASQGETVEASAENLKEALELYYEDNPADTNIESAFFTTLEVQV